MSGTVLLYLGAVVAANLIVTAWGPAASVLTAFLLIGFNITARDRLHDAWHGEGLRWKMAALIAAGGALSWLVNADAARIALASSVAFAVSEGVDALVYHGLRHRPWFQRVNGSNVVSAGLDSFLFPALAFGGFLPLIVLGQFLAKTLGGALWSVVFRRPAIAVACLALLPAGLSGQVVSMGAATVATEYGGEHAAEVFVAAPPLWTLRPNVVVSYAGSDPVVLTKLSRELLRDGPAFVSVEAGLDWLPFRDYEPEPLVGLYASAPLPLPRLSLAGALGAEPWQNWAWTAVLKVDLLLWFRR